MFQLDDQFLQDLGLEQLPEDQKQAFLAHILETLEERVGIRLSDGLSDAQLAEFESIIDKQPGAVEAWLAANAPNYREDPLYVRLQQGSDTTSGEAPDLAAEFAATKWLEKNRPDYRQVVAEVLDALKREIMGSRDQLLG